MTAPPTIAVLGSEGLLGSELVRQLGRSSLALSRRDCDICDNSGARSTLVSTSPRIVINAAGYTKVDLAEREQLACMRLNTEAVENLARICDEIDALFVQISTDYVFGGDERRRDPYREHDPPAPQSVYAHSKLAGEQAAATAKRHLIVRTCGLYGPRNKPTQCNFVDTILRLARERDRLRVVDDQWCTPTSVADAARATLFLANSGRQGIYHVVNADQTTWFHFADQALRFAGLSVPIDPITTAEYGAAARRPAYSVLNTDKYLSTTGPQLPPWRMALAAYLGTLTTELRAGKANEPRAA